MKREPTYVGIDVAKDRVDIAVRPTGQSWSASYEEEEVEKLAARLQGLEPAAVILEASGGPHHQDSGEAKIRESTAGGLVNLHPMIRLVDVPVNTFVGSLLGDT